MKLSPGKKPSRAEAFGIVLDLKFGTRELTGFNIDDLVRFFAPAMPAKAKSAEQWVAKAAGTNDVRNFLNYVYVADGFCYGSNGHRAHRCKTAMEPGFYDPKTLLPVDLNERYPDIARVFMGRESATEYAVESLQPGGIAEEKKASVLEYMRVPEKTAVSRLYLAEALNGIESGPVYYEYGSTPVTHKMWGDSEFGDWVIMGMRV